MSFEITGKLYKIFDTQQVTERFQKREFVLEAEDGAYSQYIKFQLLQDRCDLLDKHKEGEEVKLSFNIKGREYNKPGGDTMYFTNLDAWRVDPVTPASNMPAANGGTGTNVPFDDSGFPSAADAPSTEMTDDLPF